MNEIEKRKAIEKINITNIMKQKRNAAEKINVR